MNLKFIRRNFNTNLKSIYKSSASLSDKIKILDIAEFGNPITSRYLKQKASSNTVHYSNNKVKEFISSLKATAAYNNVYSLSATQLKSNLPIFCFYNDLSSYKWTNSNPKKKLIEKNYEVCINPKIYKISNIHHYEYEECPSFKILKAKVRRPLTIVAIYINEEGKNCEIELSDFAARVFCHEYDHLIGNTILNWRVSKCDLIIDGEENLNKINLNSDDKEKTIKNKRFIYTLEHYKNKLMTEGNTKPNIFDKYDIQLLNKEHESFPEEQLSIENDLRDKKEWTTEDIMWIDLEKAIRLDSNIKLNHPVIPFEEN